MLTIESTQMCGQTPRILFLLEELGEPYELVLRPDSYFMETQGRPGPIVRDGDVTFKNGLTAFRSLARTRGGGRLMPSEPARRALAEEWMDDAWALLGLSIVTMIKLRKAGAPEHIARDFMTVALRDLEAALSRQDFVCGEFSAADCALGVVARLGPFVDLSPYPAVTKYANALAARPAYLRASRALAGIATPEQVHGFWFGAPVYDEAGVISRVRRWFVEGSKLDAQIRASFGATIEAAMAGKLGDWAETPRGALALVLVLDQFSRHAYRSDARSYQADGTAIAVARAAIDRGDLKSFEDTAERIFLAMPLLHAESVDLLTEHGRITEEIARIAPAHYSMMIDAGREQSDKYRTIIGRFGRFPHRNAILGRESTPEELEFLQTFAAAAPPKVARELAISRAADAG